MKKALAAAILVARIGLAGVDFDRQVHPILAARCFACHGGDKRSGGLSLSTYAEILRGGKTGKVVNPGSSGDSLLVHRVLAEGVPPMPPVGERLSAPEIAVLRAWIDEGAPRAGWRSGAGPNWVPKMALSKPAPAGRAPNPIDRFLRGYFSKHGVELPEPVADAAFARRAYLDAWGLLPTPEQLAAFTGNRDALVAELLANNSNYSEHWITFWNDLLRNEEGVNYAGTRKSITAWLLKSLEDNKPYNQLVAELLNPAGETAPEGFLMGVNWRGDINASQTPVMQAAQNSAQVFLGVNLKCNSCHDSFISRWKLKDAYGLASFFSEDKLELVRCDVKLGQFAEAKFLYPELGGVDANGVAGRAPRGRRPLVHQPGERALRAHHCQSHLETADRPRAGGAGRRHGRRALESGAAGLAGGGFRRARIRSEASDRADHDVARLSGAGGGARSER